MMALSGLLYAVAGTVVTVTALLALARAFLGPSVYDRILAVNMLGSHVILLIVVFGYMTDRPQWEDIALLYALINCVGTIAVLRLPEMLKPVPTPPVNDPRP